MYSKKMRRKMKRLQGLIFLLTVLLTMSWTSPSQAADIVIGFTGTLDLV